MVRHFRGCMTMKAALATSLGLWVATTLFYAFKSSREPFSMKKLYTYPFDHLQAEAVESQRPFSIQKNTRTCLELSDVSQFCNGAGMDFNRTTSSTLQHFDALQSIVSLGRMVQNDRHQLAVLTVSADILEIAQNWFCWSQEIGFTNFMFVAFDLKSYEHFSIQNISVILLSSDFNNANDKYCDISSSYAAYTLLCNGMDVLIANVDAVWFGDPFDHLNTSLVVQGYIPYDTTHRHDFLLIKNRQVGIRFLKQVLSCSEEDGKDSHETNCIQRPFSKMELEPLIGLADLFPNCSTVFSSKHFLNKQNWPIVIWNMSKDVMKENHLWNVDSTLRCSVKHAQQKIIERPPPLAIQVLTFNRPASLLRLLTSLNVSEYMGHVVHLYISIDGLPMNPRDSLISSHSDVIKVVDQFEWPHGNLYVNQWKENKGLVGQWLNFWNASDDSEIRVVFEDDLVVSKFWYRWAYEAIQKYYGKSDQLSGISLGRQNYNLHSRKWLPKIATRLPKDHSVWLYQLLSTWGTIVFPKFWREFLHWKKFESPAKPCVPQMKTNDWWKAKPSSMWSAWYIRFVFEKGYFTLLPRFKGTLSIVVNMREKGEHNKRSFGAESLMKQSIDEQDFRFPPIEDLELFDFSAQSVSKQRVSLKYRYHLLRFFSEDDMCQV